jgi:nucleoside-diphosphate-sugar epimerase
VTQGDSNAISLLGCGWLGFPLSLRLLQMGAKVLGSTTTPARLKVLSSMGIEAFLLRLEPEDRLSSDASPPQVLRFLSSPTLILNIPPSTAFGADYHPSQVEGLLKRLTPGRLRHLIYVSSTSVYGAHQGEVDESTPPTPDEGTGRILIEVEQRLSAAAAESSFGLTIVRPGGLIGMGRHPGKFLAGRSGLKDPKLPVNLIHQTDLVESMASLATQNPPKPGESRIYNAVARLHPSRSEFYTRAAILLGLPPPTFVDDTASDSRGKLVRAERIRTATGVEFCFDDLLAALGERRL